MLDIEALTYQLLLKGLADKLTVKPELDVDENAEQPPIPLLVYAVTADDAVEGSINPPSAWNAQLTLTLLGHGLDETRALAGKVYDAVWAWNNPWTGAGIITGLGHAAEVEDRSLMSRVSTTQFGGRLLVQYAGQWGLQLHAA